MATSLEFWYRRKFNLAPTDPRYLDATYEQIEAEYWAHVYFDKPPGEEIEDEDFDKEAVMKQMEEEDDPADWGEPI
jgi:hypothetical protein